MHRYKLLTPTDIRCVSVHQHITDYKKQHKGRRVDKLDTGVTRVLSKSNQHCVVVFFFVPALCRWAHLTPTSCWCAGFTPTSHRCDKTPPVACQPASRSAAAMPCACAAHDYSHIHCYSCHHTATTAQCPPPRSQEGGTQVERGGWWFGWCVKRVFVRVLSVCGKLSLNKRTNSKFFKPPSLSTPPRTREPRGFRSSPGCPAQCGVPAASARACAPGSALAGRSHGGQRGRGRRG